MNFSLSKKEIEEIDSKKLHSLNKLYSSSNGVSSQLLSVKDNTIILQVLVDNEWLLKLTPEQTAFKFLNTWKRDLIELQQCQYYTVYVYLEHLLVGSVTDGYTKTILEVSSNKILYNLLNKFEIKLNAYPFQSNIYKIYLDIDTVFYSLDFDSFFSHLVYEKYDFYNNNVKGIPCFLKFPTTKTHEYITYPYIGDVRKLRNRQQYAVFTYIKTGFRSTNTGLTIDYLTLNRIEILKKVDFSESNLLETADVHELRNIGFI